MHDADGADAQEQADLARAREYLRTHGATSIPVVSQALGIPMRVLASWMTDGRLSRSGAGDATPSPGGERRCIVCKGSAVTDICDGCRTRFQRSSGVTPALPDPRARTGRASRSGVDPLRPATGYR